ncbi:MAG: M23 family metallopeptidase [Acidobacteria bacterium]|nr:M23 family metallopeptidase [Acidobacteriota bacterium]MBS1865816.1 M23 family metallopeptidase [Acidobacteriota bacterium]
MRTRLRVFFVCLLFAAVNATRVAAQQCTIVPKAANLGETLRLTCTGDVASAKWNDRTIHLFPQSDGKKFGLMPVSVKDAPGPDTIEFLSSQGAKFDSEKFTVRATRFPSENVRLSADIEALRSTPEEIKLLTDFRNGVSELRFWQDPLAPPVDGCVTSPFGVKRLHNGKPTGEFHGGIDQRTPAGEPIRAIADGKIVYAQKFNVLGNAVGIDHGQGLGSMYLHMSKLEVTPGSSVKKGDVLGYAGSTGRSTGPHLHWVLYANGVNVNAAQWVKLAACPRPPKTK